MARSGQRTAESYGAEFHAVRNGIEIVHWEEHFPAGNE